MFFAFLIALTFARENTLKGCINMFFAFLIALLMINLYGRCFAL